MDPAVGCINSSHSAAPEQRKLPRAAEVLRAAKQVRRALPGQHALSPPHQSPVPPAGRQSALAIGGAGDPGNRWRRRRRQSGAGLQARSSPESGCGPGVLDDREEARPETQRSMACFDALAGGKRGDGWRRHGKARRWLRATRQSDGAKGASC